MKMQLKADIMLFFVTLCWGVSYFLIDISLADLQPLTLNAFRFLGAFILIGVLSFKKLKSTNYITLKYSFILGIILVFVYVGATYGVKYTSISNSGFLCALSVIFTPLLELFILKKRPELKLVVAVCISIIGIILLTVKGDFSISSDNLKGNILCLMCAFAYSIALIVTDRAVNHKDVKAYQIGVFQLGFTGIFMLVLSFIFEQPHFPGSAEVWLSVLFLTVFCTGLAYVAQAIAQQYTTASHVGVIYTLEPVFSAIVAYIFADEVLGMQGYIGAVLMILALFVMEINIKIFQKR